MEPVHLATPPSITVETTPDRGGYRESGRRGSLRITRAAREPGAFVLVGFAVFWNALVAGFEYRNHVGTESLPIGVELFMVPFVLAGLALVYGSLALIFNRLTIEVRDGVLRVGYGPFRTRRSVRIDAARVQRCFLYERLRPDEGAGHLTYTICVDVDGSVRDLVELDAALETEARFMQQVLARHLGLAELTAAQ